MVVESNESGLPPTEGKGNLFEISLLLEKISISTTKVPESPQVLRAESSKQAAQPSYPLDIESKPKASLPSLDQKDCAPNCNNSIENIISHQVNDKVKSLAPLYSAFCFCTHYFLTVWLC